MFYWYSVCIPYKNGLYRNTTTLINFTTEIRMNKSIRSVFLMVLGALLNISLLGQAIPAPSSFAQLKYSDNVEMRSNYGSVKLSASNAKSEVESFFKKVSPKKVKTLHKGFSKDKSSYYGILQLVSNSGNHRIFYFCENVGGEYQITKVRVHER